jgi:ubiquinone/menaquinone biosynthesis C-methylase UbiE
MTNSEPVSEHYTHGRLVAVIRERLAAVGKTPDSVTIDDLAAVDEFHIGGRQATEHFIGQLDLTADDRVLDVGCGIGGASRFVAECYGCRVSGIDLTPEYVETARTLCEWVGLGERVTIQQASALEMPFDDGVFEAAYMLHVGMNIADKTGLCAEVARVLGPRGIFAVYDVMRTGDVELVYPVPWAETPKTSAVASPNDYKAALNAAGFEISTEHNRWDFAIAYFKRMRSRATEVGGGTPLGRNIEMGEQAPLMLANMRDNITAGGTAPVEIIARRSV